MISTVQYAVFFHFIISCVTTKSLLGGVSTTGTTLIDQQPVYCGTAVGDTVEIYALKHAVGGGEGDIDTA
jgi:hypothetical protein